MICLNIFSINLLSNKYSTGSIPRTQTLELLLRITLQQINLAFLLHRTLLYRCQYCNAELIGCLEENQFPSIRNRIYPMSYIYIYIGFVVDTFFYICIHYLSFIKVLFLSDDKTNNDTIFFMRSISWKTFRSNNIIYETNSRWILHSFALLSSFINKYYA